MELQQNFEQAVANSKTLASKPDTENLLKLYSLYKQAMEGDNNNPEPSNPFDIVAKAKYNSWQSLKGLSIDDAKQQYIDFVKELQQA